MDILAGQGIEIGYFVIVLTQMFILTPLISKINSIKIDITLIISFTIVGKLYTYGLNHIENSWIADYPFNGLPFFVWYPFYHLGYVMARRVDLTRPRPPLLLLGAVGASVGVIASIAEGISFLPDIPAFANSQLKISSMIYSVSIAILMTALYPFLRHRVPQWLAWVGENSYVIYLAHLIPVWIVAQGAIYIGIAGGTFLFVASVSVVTFLICIAGLIVAQYCVPTRMRPYITG